VHLRPPKIPAFLPHFTPANHDDIWQPAQVLRDKGTLLPDIPK
jgi:hypothetical protein